MTGIDHLIFDNATWIQKTPEVADKLSNYDTLKSFKDNIKKSLAKTYVTHRDNVSVEYIDKDGKEQMLDVGTHLEIRIDDSGNAYLTDLAGNR